VPAPNLQKLRGALLKMSARSAPSRASVITTYYDTADRQLRRRGLSLRVREVEGRFVQTLKANGTAEAGVLSRGEWEDEIAGAAPDLRAPNSGCRLAAEIAQDLRPLFATAVTRTTIALEPSPSLSIEAAIDEGEIRGISAARSEPISEIELELKRGEPSALFDAALELLALAPLHIEMRSKAERGYAAIASEAAPARPVHAAPIALDPAMSVESVLKAIGRACLFHLLQNEAAALAGDPEGVHQMRVASRRIQAAISALKKMLPRAERRRVQGELDRLDEALGPARNLDVFASDLLAPARAGPSAEPALDPLAAAVAAARQSACGRVRELILSPRYTEAMLSLLRSFEGRGWRAEATAGFDPLSEPIGDLAPRLLDRARSSVKKRGKGFRRASARERHKLRIAVKELRYTAELLASLFDPQAAGNFAKPLKALQDDLGYANDVQVGREVLQGICADVADKEAIAALGGRVLEWHEKRIREVERKVEKHLRRLKRAKPFWNPARPAPPAAASTPDQYAAAAPQARSAA
jgi:inorganic triphosphatase YgiF